MNRKIAIITTIFIFQIFLFLALAPSVSASPESYTYTPEQDWYNWTNDNITKTSNLRNPEIIDEGNYTGLYSFDNEVGLSGTDIDFVDDSYGYELDYLEVIDSYEGHDTVLNFTDSTGYSFPHILDTSISGHAYVELWTILISDFTGSAIQINLVDGSSTITAIRFAKGSIGYVRIYYASTYFTYPCDVFTWSHIRFELDFDDDTFDFYYNGTLVLDDYAFYLSADYDELTSMDFDVYTVDSIGMIDAIGYNSTLYTKNTNMYEIRNVDTSKYEVDKYCFHQTSHDNIDLSYGAYPDGFLGWDVNLGTGGEVNVGEGWGPNPETGVYDSDNRYIRLQSTDTYITSFSHDFDESALGTLQVYFDGRYAYTGDNYRFTGLYAIDSTSDVLACLVFSSNGDNTWDLKIGNGEYGESIEVLTSLAENSNFNITWTITNTIQIIEFQSSELGIYENYTYNVYNDGDGFVEIHWDVFGGTSNWFYFDNLGIYANGSSLVTEEHGYAEINDADLMAPATLSIDYAGLIHVATVNPSGTTFNIPDDTLTNITELDDYGWTQMSYKEMLESIIFCVNGTGYFYTNFSIEGTLIYLNRNDAFEVYGIDDSGSEIDTDSYFYVENDLLFGYNIHNGSDEQALGVVFDVNNIECANNSIRVNNVFRSNWLFSITMTFEFTDNTFITFELDNSDDYDYDGSVWYTDFGSIVPDYKVLDKIYYYIHPSDDSDNTSILAGFESIELILRSTGIGLDDLHDTGILSILVPIVALLVPSVIIPMELESRKRGMGKKTFIPIFAMFTVILFATSVLPAWLFFVCMISCGMMLFVKGAHSSGGMNVNLGLSLQAKKDKLSTEKEKKKDREFKNSYEYEMSKLKSMAKIDKKQKKAYRKNKKADGRVRKV
jgi:hypothetical protein